MKSFKAIIFDMDGVLVDSEPSHILIEKKMFKKMGLNFSDKEHAGYMGTATDVMWKQIIEKRNLPLDVNEITSSTNIEANHFFSNLKKMDPMPGLIELLKLLRTKSIPMAVASSSDSETIKIILDKSGLRKYFHFAISSREVGKSKPEPDVFLYTANLLKAKPQDCLVVEDSKNGIKAAKAAGMFCVAYSGATSGKQNQSEADLVIDNFNKLAEFLFNKNVESD